ncbi:MAG: 5-oxoprolinase subunit PxpA [Gallicola sp.]|nr:5-oxoprolinase subunit PxpA [Gallicola sp.]
MYKVDLNSDLGESFGRYTLGNDERIISLISSANIACGFHASDPLVMDKTVALAKKYGAGLGAHPGFPDLMGFGRRNMVVTPQEARNYITYQIGALAGFCKSHGVNLAHVKPHGALYNMAGKDPVLAEAICEAIARYDENLILLGLAGSELLKAAEKKGLASASEFFADRAYEEDGSLRNRKLEGAMITDEDLSVKRIIQAVTKGTLTTYSGKDIPVKVDSICVHGDGEKALLFVERIRKALTEAEIEIAPLSKVVG